MTTWSLHLSLLKPSFFFPFPNAIAKHDFRNIIILGAWRAISVLCPQPDHVTCLVTLSYYLFPLSRSCSSDIHSRLTLQPSVASCRCHVTYQPSLTLPFAVVEVFLLVAAAWFWQFHPVTEVSRCCLNLEGSFTIFRFCKSFFYNQLNPVLTTAICLVIERHQILRSQSGTSILRLPLTHGKSTPGTPLTLLTE